MPTVSVKKLNPIGTLAPGNEAVLEAEKDISLWESLEKKGHKLPSGCLNGACAACRIQVIEGEESLAPMGATEEATVKRLIENSKGKPDEEKYQGKTIRLSCQAKVIGDAPIAIAPLN